MKFRYIFIGDDGWMTGSNSEEVKDQMLTFDIYTVYDCALGQKIYCDGSKHDVQERNLYVEEEEAEEEEEADPDDEATPGRTVHHSLLPNPDEDTPFDER